MDSMGRIGLDWSEKINVMLRKCYDFRSDTKWRESFDCTFMINYQNSMPKISQNACLWRRNDSFVLTIVLTLGVLVTHREEGGRTEALMFYGIFLRTKLNLKALDTSIDTLHRISLIFSLPILSIQTNYHHPFLITISAQNRRFYALLLIKLDLNLLYASRHTNFMVKIHLIIFAKLQ